MIYQNEIRKGLLELGLQPGDAVLVHSALSSLGKVDGGADTVIDALIDVLGPNGTLLMPALSTGVFDQANSPSKVGLLTETFRRRKGVIRSFHPSHSVTALGARAEALTSGHFHCPTACGEGTPYAKLMDGGGKILLLGVDQDRNTSLHGLEAMAQLPYLKTITREYLDPQDGCTKHLEIREYPGPHRDFIGLDRRLREAGVMKIGKVGKAVCRLIDAGRMRDLLLPALRNDPTLILCNNPNCRDCIIQRASVKRARLQQEDFVLSVVSDAAGRSLQEIFEAIAAEGITHLELREVDGREVADYSDLELASLRARLETEGVGICAVSTRLLRNDFERLVDVATQLGAPTVVLPLDRYTPDLGKRAAEAGIYLSLENIRETSAGSLERFQGIRETRATLAFNPAHFASMGEKPFLKVYSKTPLKRWVGQLRFSDGTFDGQATLPGYGNGEVRELLSILRCASFEEPVVITPIPGLSFKQVVDAFWESLDHL